jgi:serine/threonine protein kinase
MAHGVGKYNLIRLLSHEGNFSNVYLAHKVGRDDEKVAIKMYTDWAMSDENREVLDWEIEHLRNKTHPNICSYTEFFFVTVDDLLASPLRDSNKIIPSSFADAQAANSDKCFDTAKSRKCVVLEYCNQGSLTDKISESKNHNQCLPPDKLLNIALQLSNAVAFLSETKSPDAVPIVHCDIKPDNIFLNIDIQGNLAVKLGDLGVAIPRDFRYEVKSLRANSKATEPGWLSYASADPTASPDPYDPTFTGTTESKLVSLDAYCLGVCILKLASVDTDPETTVLQRTRDLDQVGSYYASTLPGLRAVLERAVSTTDFACQLSAPELVGQLRALGNTPVIASQVFVVFYYFYYFYYFFFAFFLPFNWAIRL